LKQSNYIQI